MNTLQISPVVGFKPAAAPTGSPAGEAPSAHPDSKSTSAPATIFNPNGQTQDQIVATRESAARAAELRTEEEKKAAQAKEDEKALDLKVGLVNGNPGKVFIDIVDSKLHRTVYRIFGPPGDETAKHDAGTDGAKAADASNAYSRIGSAPADHPTNVKTEV
jgi:hypothetical protein